MENTQESQTAQAGGGTEKITFVKSATPTKSLAVFITTSATKEKLDYVKIRGVGAGAINQMVKATISATSKLAEKGIKTSIEMYYQDVDGKESDSGTISAIELCIKFNKI